MICVRTFGELYETVRSSNAIKLKCCDSFFPCLSTEIVVQERRMGGGVEVNKEVVRMTGLH